MLRWGREAARSRAAGALAALEEEYRAVDIRADLTSKRGAERGPGRFGVRFGEKTSLQHTWYLLSGEIFSCQDTVPDIYDPSPGTASVEGTASSPPVPAGFLT